MTPVRTITSVECNAGKHYDYVAGRRRLSGSDRRSEVHTVDCAAAVTQRGAGHHAPESTLRRRSLHDGEVGWKSAAVPALQLSLVTGGVTMQVATR